MASSKVEFAIKVRSQVTMIANAINELEALQRLYFHRGYDTVGVDPITEPDLSDLNMTPEQLASLFSPLVEQLINFRDNQAVAQGNHGAIMDAVRLIE